MKTKTTKVAVVPSEEGKTDGVSVELLISRAIDNKLPVDTMERLLAMREKMKAEYAKEEYNRAMAAFQGECPVIEKTKEVKTRAGIVAYKYAPIESIVEQVKPYLQKHGFSYSSNMELLESGVKVTIKITHELGHSEISEMEVPLGNKTDIMSASQVVAAAQTFAKRYAFCNAFGILTGDEDTDARPEQKEPVRQPTDIEAKKIRILELLKSLGIDTKDRIIILDKIKELTGLEATDEANADEIISRLQVVNDERKQAQSNG
jgi:hypothetical protein